MADQGQDVEIPDKLFFRIGEVAELVEVEPHVLRYWEGEFRMRPTRSRSGQRMYRQKDISKFLRIRRLLHGEGYTIAGARKVLKEGRKSSGVQPVGVDEAPLRDALERLGELRQRIAAARERFLTQGSGSDR